MKYTTEIDTEARKIISSVLKGSDRPTRINSDGVAAKAKDSDKDPLVRMFSRDRVLPFRGDYSLMVKEGRKWVFFHKDLRFTSLTEAQACLPGLHLLHDEIMVVQLWANWKGYGPVLERDTDEMREYTGEDEN